MDMALEKCLTLSTLHMPDDEPDFGNIRTAPHQYGVIAFVATTTGSTLAWAPPWLQPIYAEALREGCTLILFDRDEEPEDHFKVYDW